jgi:hypothetical protein
VNFLRVLLVFVFLLIVSIVLQFITVPFSATHNTFALLESVDRSLRGVVLGGLLWLAIRLIKGEHKTPEISRFILFVAVIFVVGRAVYDLVAV